MTTEYGGGIFLTSELDFELNETGDIRTVRGIDELEKDIAFQTIQALDEFIGRPKTRRTKSIIETRIKRIIQLEPRVDERTSEISLRYPETKPNTIEVTVSVRTTQDEEQELVFLIGE